MDIPFEVVLLIIILHYNYSPDKGPLGPGESLE